MVTVIAAVAIWQVLASWRARMSVACEEAYRKLGEESTDNQRQIADQQKMMATDISAIKTKMESIESS